MWPPTGTSDMKACKVCAEPIKKAARICTHCNSYQDWRIGLSMSNTVLALLVALIAVVTAAVPVFKEAFTPKNSSLAIAFQVANTKALTVLVTNTGIRPGTVSQPMSVHIYEKTLAPLGQIEVPLHIVDQTDLSSFLIEPGKSVLLSTSFDRSAQTVSLNVP